MMINSIFRPKGLLIRTNSKNLEYQKIPILCLDFGSVTFQKKGLMSDDIVTGLHIHKKLISLHLSIEKLNNDQGKCHWSSLAFNFTLFNLWIDGLSLDERESVIDEILAWQEEAQIKSLQHNLNLKNVA